MTLSPPPLLPDELESVARVKIRSGSVEKARRALRLIGSGVTVGIVDDPINEEVEITLTTDVTQAELNAVQAEVDAVETALEARIRAPGTTLPASPADGQLFYDTDDDRLYVYNGTAWVCITPVSATVAASQTETSTTYDDMTTVGPTVSLLTGTSVTVWLSAFVSGNTINARNWTSVAVSGVTTQAATDARGVSLQAYAVGAGDRIGDHCQITGLTPGLNTFTSKYRVTSGTGTFADRTITVIAHP